MSKLSGPVFVVDDVCTFEDPKIRKNKKLKYLYNIRTCVRKDKKKKKV